MMLERQIKQVDGGFVVYKESGDRVEAFLTATSAERAATASLKAQGGGTIVRVDGARVTVDAEQSVAAG
jgi:hypothetical protein